MQVNWQDIEEQLTRLQDVDGGFSQAQRGIVTLPDGQELFVKVGLHENTKEWAKKEIAVYRFLEKHNYPHSPRLVATNADETGFALPAHTPAKGWDWQDNWSAERLTATMQAMEDLAAIELDETERAFFSQANISQDDNGWRPLLASPEKQAILIKKLQDIGAEDIASTINFAADSEKSEQFIFAVDTLVHYDLRADNCAWNADLGQVRLVDWNWTQLGDKRIELAESLTHVQKSGFEVPSNFKSKLSPDALHWMAGFWFNAAATPIWPGGPEHLRGLQLLAGVTALRLSR